METLQPSQFRERLLSSGKPVVLKNMLSWNSVPSTLAAVKQELGDLVLEFRVTERCESGSVWEGDADFVKSSIADFIEWAVDSPEGVADQNPFSCFTQGSYWAYSSYNYMHNTFNENCPIMKGVDWSPFGFSEHSGKDSVFWIGSPGAYTPCHMDTYGCNLVAQLIGRKSWILFPPADGKFLYPTRIPYEESSVFSSADVLKPDLSKWPLFKKCHPHTVILEPGDVLFVPPKWWHFVQSLDVTVSINTWIELDSDDEARLGEAVCGTLMSVLIPAFDVTGTDISWLNPRQELMAPDEALSCVRTCLKRIGTISEEKEKVGSDDDVSGSAAAGGPCPKVPRLTVSCNENSSQFLLPVLSEVKAITYTDYETRYCSSKSKHCTKTLDTEKTPDLKSIISCFVHPDVVSIVVKKLISLKEEVIPKLVQEDEHLRDQPV